jgi:hypothetical protein
MGSVMSFLSAAKRDWPITTAIINRICFMPTPYASRPACSRTDATLFWTCIKFAKALREFDGED